MKYLKSGCEALSERYYGLSGYLKNKFGEKIVKLSLDGNFTCPNRDGTLSSHGCIFCSARGSGEFAGVMDSQGFDSIPAQIEHQKQMLSPKWSDCGYIAYFQNYTNTYKPIEELEKLYTSALEQEGVRALAVATRPDCIQPEHIELFKSLNTAWIELGLQTIHDEKAFWLRRHYNLVDFECAFSRLKDANIPVVVHLIAGLPGETKEDFLDSVRYLSKIKPFGVKFHMLNVLKETDLESLYLREKFKILTRDEYIEWICDALEFLEPNIVVHRLTGDGDKKMIVEPLWVCDKRAVLNGINKCLVQRNSRQGIRCI